MSPRPPDPGPWQCEVEFRRGYNHRDKPGGGVHGLEIWMTLTGERGSVSVSFSTGWVPGERMSPRLARHYPSGGKVGYHAEHPYPHSNGYDATEPCRYNKSGHCFYDASFTASDELLKVLVNEGEDALWESLKQHHNEVLPT